MLVSELAVMCCFIKTQLIGLYSHEDMNSVQKLVQERTGLYNRRGGGEQDRTRT